MHTHTGKGRLFWRCVYFSWCQSRCTRGEGKATAVATNTSRKWNVSSSSSLAPPFWLLLLCFSRSSWPFTCSKVDVFGGGRGLRSIACVRRVSPSSSSSSSSSPLSPSTSSSGESCWLLLSSCLEPGEDSPTEKDVKKHLLSTVCRHLIFVICLKYSVKKIGDVAVHALFILAFSFQKIVSRHGASLSFVSFHGWTDEEEEEE